MTGFVAWKGGLSQGMMPAPYRFIGLSAIYGGCAIVGAASPRIGTAASVAFTLGLFVYYYTNSSAVTTTDALSPGGPQSATPLKTGAQTSIGQPEATGNYGGTSTNINPATGTAYGGGATGG